MSEFKNADDVLKFLLKLENEFHPQEWQTNNCDTWPLLRVSLYYELSLSMEDFNMPKSNIFQKFKRLSAINFPMYYNVKKKTELLLVSDGISYLHLNRRLYERFCDPIIEIAIANGKKGNWEKWDLAYNLKGNFKFKPVKIAGILDFILLKTKISKTNLKVNNGDKIIDLCEYMRIETRGKINWSFDGIKIKLINFQAMVDYYHNLLSKSNIKLVIIVSYYSDRAMALIYACNKLNIKTADIQHGVQGKYHAAYSNWQNIPKKGYNTLPNDFLVWSLEDKKSIENWSDCNKYHNAKVLSNAFQEKWYSYDDDQINILDDEIRTVIASMDCKETILFTLQYGIVYEDWVFQLIYDSQSKFNWLIRLHPIMQDRISVKLIKQKLRSFGIINFEIEKSSFLPLYTLLRNINLHLTHSSSTVLEAIDFQIKSILLSDYGSELFADQIKKEKTFQIYDNRQSSIDLMLSLKQKSYKQRAKNEYNTSQMAEKMVFEYLQMNI